MGSRIAARRLGYRVAKPKRLDHTTLGIPLDNNPSVALGAATLLEPDRYIATKGNPARPSHRLICRVRSFIASWRSHWTRDSQLFAGARHRHIERVHGEAPKVRRVREHAPIRGALRLVGCDRERVAEGNHRLISPVKEARPRPLAPRVHVFPLIRTSPGAASSLPRVLPPTCGGGQAPGCRDVPYP
jgi:hypothetical protein